MQELREREPPPDLMTETEGQDYLLDVGDVLSETFEEFILEHRAGRCRDRPLEEESYLAIEEDDQGNPKVLLATRNDEFDMRKANAEERKGFAESDTKEWQSVRGMNAVKVWKGAAAKDLRDKYSSRILKSRIVRRKKPMPGVGSFKYKSRWCVLGFGDPDVEDLRTFAPTPQTEVINMFFQVALNLQLKVVFGDVTSAFCQGKRLNRPAGRLFAEPCPGLGLEEGDLIELMVAVYGLEDAPLSWAETVSEFLCEELGFRRSYLDPCLFIKQTAAREVSKRVRALILLEVDDFNIAARTEYQDELLAKLKERFIFGKWEYDEADFNGRHVKIMSHGVHMHQEKYVLEKIHAIDLPRGRRSQKGSLLLGPEIESLRSMLYRISWVAHQTRPEAAGMVSILSSRLQNATVEDAILLNKMVGHLRSTAKQGIRLHPYDPEKTTFIGVSDAGGVDGSTRGTGEDGMIEDPVQGSWLVLGSDRIPTHDEQLKVSVLSWRSTKLRRRVTSTLASETLAFSQCMGEIEWMQVLYRDMVFGDVNPELWRNIVQPFACLLRNGSEMAGRQDQCGVTDAKSLYDALVKQHPASRQDRRTALELAAIIDSMHRAGSLVRWTTHQRMIADTLTKADITKGNGALLHLLKTGVLKIDDEQKELRRRGEAGGRLRSRAATTRLLESEADTELRSFLNFASQLATKVRKDY